MNVISQIVALAALILVCLNGARLAIRFTRKMCEILPRSAMDGLTEIFPVLTQEESLKERRLNYDIIGYAGIFFVLAVLMAIYTIYLSGGIWGSGLLSNHQTNPALMKSIEPSMQKIIGSIFVSIMVSLSIFILSIKSRYSTYIILLSVPLSIFVMVFVYKLAVFVVGKPGPVGF